MADSTTTILVVFGLLVILGLVGGIIAIIIVERNRKKKSEANGGNGDNGGNGGNGGDEMAIQSVFSPSKYVIGKLSPTISTLSGEFCSLFKIKYGTFPEFGIKNTLMVNLPSPFPPGILGAEPSNNSEIKVFVPANINTTKYAYSWDYVVGDKRWCLTGTDICLYTDGSELKVKTLQRPVTSNFQWNNVTPPTTVCKN